MKQRIKIINGTLLCPYRTIVGGTLLIDEGKILAISDSNLDFPDASVLDASGRYVAPGFIDLHLHGGGGYDFMDGTVEAFLKIAQTHARFGTTSLVPTTLTSTKESLLRTLDLYTEAAAQNTLGAEFLGLHLEGPYFAMSQRGAQDPRYIRDPDPAEYRDILAHAPGVVRRWSVAPERPGALEMGQFLRDRGIVASIAHTEAIHEEVLEAAQNGYSLMTHLYSGMLGVTRRNAFRYAGAVESAFLIDEMDVELITDGVHLPPSLLQLVYKIKGPDCIALITDAMRAAAQDVSHSTLGPLEGGLPVLIEDGVAKLPDRTAFAGSVATADRLLRTIMTQTDIPLHAAIQMLSATPARIMGVEKRKGSLSVGKEADIVFFNRDYQVQMTLCRGNIVYSADTYPTLHP